MRVFLSQSLLNKVPEVTLLFWLIKMLSTTVGETAADYLIFNLKMGLPLTTLIMGLLFAGLLLLQLFSKAYRPVMYWATVVMVSIVGTLITDNLTDNLGIPLVASTISFTILLGTVFFIWYQSEKTLSIHYINTRKRELFYWCAILATFALGTAAGDWFSEGLSLGYATSAAIFAAAIAAVYGLYKAKILNPVLAFWVAYVLTRPLGASLGDLLSQSVNNGGVGLGATTITVVFSAAIVAGLAYLEFGHRRIRHSEKPS